MRWSQGVLEEYSLTSSVYCSKLTDLAVIAHNLGPVSAMNLVQVSLGLVAQSLAIMRSFEALISQFKTLEFTNPLELAPK